MVPAQVVESVVLSADLQKALGIDMPYEGWFIGVKIHDANVWKKIEDGEYTGFSIGGSGIREAYDELIEKKSQYGPGKNPASHGNRKKGGGRTPVSAAERDTVNYKTDVSSPKYGLGQAKLSMRAARLALKAGDKNKAAFHASTARDWTRKARGKSSTLYDSGKFGGNASTQHQRSGAYMRSQLEPKAKLKAKSGGVDMASQGTHVGGKLRLQPELQDAPKKKKKSSKGGFGWGLR